MSRDRVVLRSRKGAFLNDVLSKFQKDPNASLCRSEKIVNHIEFYTFEPQDINLAQYLTQLIDINCHPQILPQIFDLAQQK